MEDPIKVIEVSDSGVKVKMSYERWTLWFWAGELYHFYDGPENPRPPKDIENRARRKGWAIFRQKQKKNEKKKAVNKVQLNLFQKEE